MTRWKHPNPEDGPSLWDLAKARKSDPETSKQAAAKMNRSKKVTQHNLLIVAALTIDGPQTGRELGDSTCLGQVPVMRRMSALVERGVVRDTGEKRDGQTVWEATAE